MRKLLLIALLLPLFCNAQSVKNLDIKNGFLQFHFGDSLSNYKSILRPDNIRPEYYHVSFKAVKLKHYLQKTLLHFQNNLLDGIELSVQGESNVDYMNNAMKNAYGYTREEGDTLKNQPGVHKSFLIWNGQAVSAIIEKITINIVYNGMSQGSVSETITFKRHSDIKIDGELSPDFLL